MSPPLLPLSICWNPTSNYKEHELEWTLNRFEKGELASLSLVPLAMNEPWETLPLLAARRPHELILGIFPPLLQLEHSFAAALWRAHLPTFYLPLAQAPIVPALIRELPVCTIVSLWRDRAHLHAITQAKDLQPIFYEMVLAPHERPGTHREPHTGFEVHLVPGLVVYMQCKELAGTNIFHPSERFEWEFSEGGASVTDKSPQQRFSKVHMPGIAYAETLPCVCGKHTRVTLL